MQNEEPPSKKKGVDFVGQPPPPSGTFSFTTSESEVDAPPLFIFSNPPTSNAIASHVMNHDGSATSGTFSFLKGSPSGESDDSGFTPVLVRDNTTLPIVTGDEETILGGLPDFDAPPRIQRDLTLAESHGDEGVSGNVQANVDGDQVAKIAKTPILSSYDSDSPLTSLASPSSTEPVATSFTQSQTPVSYHYLPTLVRDPSSHSFDMDEVEATRGINSAQSFDLEGGSGGGGVGDDEGGILVPGTVTRLNTSTFAHGSDFGLSGDDSNSVPSTSDNRGSLTREGTFEILPTSSTDSSAQNTPSSFAMSKGKGMPNSQDLYEEYALAKEKEKEKEREREKMYSSRSDEKGRHHQIIRASSGTHSFDDHGHDILMQSPKLGRAPTAIHYGTELEKQSSDASAEQRNDKNYKSTQKGVGHATR